MTTKVVQGPRVQNVAHPIAIAQQLLDIYRQCFLWYKNQPNGWHSSTVGGVASSQLQGLWFDVDLGLLSVSLFLPVHVALFTPGNNIHFIWSVHLRQITFHTWNYNCMSCNHLHSDSIHHFRREKGVADIYYSSLLLHLFSGRNVPWILFYVLVPAVSNALLVWCDNETNGRTADKSSCFCFFSLVTRLLRTLLVHIRTVVESCHQYIMDNGYFFLVPVALFISGINIHLM